MIYFVSDVHLGSRVIEDPAEHQQRFISLLQMMQRDASAIYLLGDVFDYWYEYHWPNERHFSQYQPVLEALREASSHCPVHFFVGNHDMWTFGWLAKRTGVEVHYGPEVLTLAGKRCLLAHGDGLMNEGWWHGLMNAIFHSRVVRFFFGFVPPFLGDALGYAWAEASRRKELNNPLPYAGEEKEELIRYAKEYDDKSVELFVFGHRHIELSFMLPSRARVYILGDFFRQFTYGCLTDDGIFSTELYEP